MKVKAKSRRLKPIILDHADCLTCKVTKLRDYRFHAFHFEINEKTLGKFTQQNQIYPIQDNPYSNSWKFTLNY